LLVSQWQYPNYLADCTLLHLSPTVPKSVENTIGFYRAVSGVGFRSNDCKGLKGSCLVLRSTCQCCWRVLHLQGFRERCQRNYIASQKKLACKSSQLSRVNNRYLSVQDVVTKTQLQRTRGRMSFFHRLRVAQQKNREHYYIIHAVEKAKQGDISGLCYAVVKLAKHKQSQCLARETQHGTKQVSSDFLQDIFKNLTVKSRGERSSPASKGFFAALKIMGGTKLAKFVGLNLCGPNPKSIGRWLSKMRQFKRGLCQENFETVRDIYARFKHERGIT
jgi:hypothetical protein